LIAKEHRGGHLQHLHGRGGCGRSERRYRPRSQLPREENAVIVGLDLVDLLNLRDALQREIDNFTLLAFEAAAMGEDEVDALENDLP
jgi:hypothetical protein